jgi:hypothetical protein
MSDKWTSINSTHLSASLPDSILNSIYSENTNIADLFKYVDFIGRRLRRNPADLAEHFRFSLSSKNAKDRCWGWITSLTDDFFDPMPRETCEGILRPILPFMEDVKTIKLVNNANVAKILKDSIVDRWVYSVKGLEFSEPLLSHFDWGNIIAKLNPAILERISMPVENHHIFEAFINQTFPVLKSAHFLILDRDALSMMEPKFPSLESLVLSHQNKSGDFLATSDAECETLFARIKRWVDKSANLRSIFIKQAWMSALPTSSYPWGDLVRFAAENSDSKIFLSSLRMLLRDKYEDIITVSQTILDDLRSKGSPLPTCLGMETLLECTYPTYCRLQHQNIKRLWAVSRMLETFAELYDFKDPVVQRAAQYFLEGVKAAMDCFAPCQEYSMIPIIGNLLVLIQKEVPGALQQFPVAVRGVEDFPHLLSILLRIKPTLMKCLPKVYLDRNLCEESQIDFNALIGKTDPFHIAELWIFDPQMLYKFVSDPRFDTGLRINGQPFVGCLLHAAAMPIRELDEAELIQQKFWLDMVYSKLLKLHERVGVKDFSRQELSWDLLAYLLNHRLTRMRKYVLFYHDVEMVIDAAERLKLQDCKYSLMDLAREMWRVAHPDQVELEHSVKAKLRQLGAQSQPRRARVH